MDINFPDLVNGAVTIVTVIGSSFGVVGSINRRLSRVEKKVDKHRRKDGERFTRIEDHLGLEPYVDDPTGVHRNGLLK